MHRALRILGWSVAAVLLLVVLLVGALLIAGNTREGRQLLEHETARLTAGRVRLAGLGGSFPSDIDIARLRLSDSRGVWMRARHISVQWAPLALLHWDLHVQAVHIAQLDIERRPVSTHSRARGKTHLPAINFDHVRIDTLVLEPAAAGTLARLTVRASVHYRSMRDARVHLLVQRTNGKGRYALTLHAAPAAIHAGLTLEEPAGGPLEHWLNLPGLGALQVKASVQGPRRAEQVRLDARVGKLRAQAGGTIDLVRRAADLSYAITSPAMAPRPGLAWQHLALTGRWRGPLTSALASGVLDLEGLRWGPHAELGALKARLAANGRVLTVQASAEHVRLPGAHPDLLQGSPLNLEATLQLHAPHRPLAVTVADRLFQVTARALTAGPRRATFTMQIPDVAPFAALYHQRLKGPMHLSGAWAERGRRTHLDVHGTGQFAGAGIAARMLGADLRLDLAASLTPTRAEVQRFTLSGRALSLVASASAERDGSKQGFGGLRSLRARWHVSLPDLRRLSSAARGSLELHGTAHGPLRTLALQVNARSTLSFHGSRPGVIQVSLSAQGLPSALKAVMRASGTFDGSPLKLDATVAHSGRRAFRLELRQARWESLSASGTIASDASLAAARGALHLSITRLADLRPLVGTALAGRIEASVRLAPLKRGPGARFDLSGRNLQVGAFQGNLNVSGAGPINALHTRLEVDSPDVHGAPANVTATAEVDAPAHRIELVNFAAHYRGQQLRLLSPSRVSFAAGLKVHQLRLGIQRAVIALDGEISPALDVRASIHHVDAGLIDAFVPHLLAHGSLDAEARLVGSRQAPTGALSVTVSGVRFASAAAEGLPAIEAHAAAHLHGHVAEVSATLDAGRASRLALSGHAPLGSAGSLALNLTGRLDIALANAMLEARGERAQGTVVVDAHVDGSVHEPQIHGTVALTHGDLRDYAKGVHIGDINARLVGDHGVLRIASLTARAGLGHLSAHGTIGVLRPQMPIDVSVSARNIQPITSDILTANLDADLRVAGTLRRRLDVTGSILVHHAAITIPNALPPNVATLKVIRPGEVAAPAHKPHRLRIDLGLSLRAPEAIFVRGRGLNAQLGGALKISGTTAHPQVSGGFTMTRGTFSLAGTNLNFTHGRVGFNGEGLRGSIDPTLDFVAQSTVTYTTATTVTLRVSGFADAPKISLSSTPVLPQDDLLALLLFGKPASQLSPFELAQIGAGLASMSGIGGGGASRWNPLTWIKHYLGLNTLSVASTAPTTTGHAQSGTSVAVGKYISNRVYVAASHTTQGSNQIRVDISLTKNLKLETRLGNGTASAQGTTPENDPGSSIGLAYQVRY